MINTILKGRQKKKKFRIINRRCKSVPSVRRTLRTRIDADNTSAVRTHLTTGRLFGRVKRKLSCDGSVTYFSAFCRLRRRPSGGERIKKKDLFKAATSLKASGWNFFMGRDTSITQLSAGFDALNTNSCRDTLGSQPLPTSINLIITRR